MFVKEICLQRYFVLLLYFYCMVYFEHAVVSFEAPLVKM